MDTQFLLPFYNFRLVKFKILPYSDGFFAEIRFCDQIGKKPSIIKRSNFFQGYTQRVELQNDPGFESAEWPEKQKKIKSIYFRVKKLIFFYLSYSIISSGARGLRKFCQPITSSVARGLRDFGEPTTSSEARGLMDLGHLTTSSEARGSRNLGHPTNSNEARGLRAFVNIPLRAKREAQGILINLSSRAKRAS